MARKPRPHNQTKLFVLDTNVLLHDPTCLYRFQEHDIYLPMATLEELDHNKKGMSEVARNARQASRFLDEVVRDGVADIHAGIDLAPHSHGAASGRLYLQTELIESDITAMLPASKVDNQLLGVVYHLKKAQPKRPIILVSKDINMRIKARALGIPAEDYFNDKVLEDTDLLYSGVRELPADFWDTHGKGMESWKEASHVGYRIQGPLCASLHVNEFVYQEPGRGGKPFYAVVREITGNAAILHTITCLLYTSPSPRDS
mgnify:CR=1 FL=1